jgi:hypothetical protein
VLIGASVSGTDVYPYVSRLHKSVALTPDVLLEQRCPQLRQFLRAVLEHATEALDSSGRPAASVVRLSSMWA